MAKRGQLTERIQAQAKLHLGREITTTELRLYAYLDYQIKNEQRLDPAKCNQADRDVLSILRKEGHIEGGASGLAMTKEFYNIMQIILWLGYVAYDEKTACPATINTRIGGSADAYPKPDGFANPQDVMSNRGLGTDGGVQDG